MRVTLDQYRTFAGNTKRKRPVRLAQPSEAQLQALCVTWFRTEPALRQWRILHIPNQGSDRKYPGRMAKLIAMGFVIGAADLLLIQPDTRCAFVEMKRPGEKLRQGQVEFEEDCLLRGVPVARCESFTEFQAFVRRLQKNIGDRLTPMRRQA